MIETYLVLWSLLAGVVIVIAIGLGLLCLLGGGSVKNKPKRKPKLWFPSGTV